MQARLSSGYHEHGGNALDQQDADKKLEEVRNAETEHGDGSTGQALTQRFARSEKPRLLSTWPLTGVADAGRAPRTSDSSAGARNAGTCG